MKKLFISGLLALTLITSSFAAPASGSRAMDHFTSSFANAKGVSWKITDRFEKVSFTLNNEKVDAFYDNNGEMIGISKTMAFDKLPKSALETLTTKYTFPEYQLKDCIEFTNADNEKNFYVSFDTKNESIVLEITKAGGVSVMSKTRK